MAASFVAGGLVLLVGSVLMVAARIPPAPDEEPRSTVSGY
jgi:hypothetical protein